MRNETETKGGLSLQLLLEQIVDKSSTEMMSQSESKKQNRKHLSFTGTLMKAL